VFTGDSVDMRQAAARAILAVGGQPAVDSLARLAFTGPVPAQRYAVLVLMLMPNAPKDAALKRIAETHQDQQVRELIAHGFPKHEH